MRHDNDPQLQREPATIASIPTNNARTKRVSARAKTPPARERCDLQICTDYISLSHTSLRAAGSWKACCRRWSRVCHNYARFRSRRAPHRQSLSIPFTHLTTGWRAACNLALLRSLSIMLCLVSAPRTSFLVTCPAVVVVFCQYCCRWWEDLLKFE